MTDLGGRPLVGPGAELQLTIDDRAVPHPEVLAAVEVLEAERVLPRAPAREETAGEVGERLPLEPENLYARERLPVAARHTPSTLSELPSLCRSPAPRAAPTYHWTARPYLEDRKAFVISAGRSAARLPA